MTLRREELIEACTAAVERGTLSRERFDKVLAAFDHNDRERCWKVLRKVATNRLCGYAVLREVGSGASSRVFKALDTKRDRFVALKILRSSLSDDPVQKLRFRREAHMLAQLSHPNIVRVRAHGRKEGKNYIVLDWVDGVELKAKVDEHGPLGEDEVLRTGIYASRALEYAHRRGLVHRDVKPQNLILSSEDRVYLTDFGLAKEQESELGLTQAGEMLGTPEFISPEQAMEGHVDARSDIYGLGATLFFLATGRPPFEGDSPFHIIAQHQHQPPPDPRSFVPALSEASAGAILRCLAKNPSDRFDQASDLLASLGRILMGARTGVAPLSPVAPPPLPSSTDLSSGDFSWGSLAVVAVPPPSPASDAKNDSSESTGTRRKDDVDAVHPLAVKRSRGQKSSSPPIPARRGPRAAPRRNPVVWILIPVGVVGFLILYWFVAR